jgi:ABC-type protease/lipase transport system fused ATPase/permease subunit
VPPPPFEYDMIYVVWNAATLVYVTGSEAKIQTTRWWSSLSEKKSQLSSSRHRVDSSTRQDVVVVCVAMYPRVQQPWARDEKIYLTWRFVGAQQGERDFAIDIRT